MAAHESPRTTKPYDCTGDEITSPSSRADAAAERAMRPASSPERRFQSLPAHAPDRGRFAPKAVTGSVG